MDGDQVVDSGTAVDTSGGVGNGQATGTGHVSDSFNVSAAVDSIGDSLGFKKPEAAAETTSAPVAKPVAAAPVTDTPPVTSTTTDTVPPTDIAPKTWKKEEAEAWATISPAAKAAISRREEEMFRGLEQYKQTAGFGNSVQAVIAPYSAIMQAQNIDPVQMVKGYMDIEYRLHTGTPEQKTQLFKEFAQRYNVPISSLTGNATDDAYADPQIASLQRELAELKAGQSSIQQQRFQESQAKTNATVQQFFSDAKNIYVNDVADDIAHLLNTDKTLTLEQAYEKAIWLNPNTRAKEIARQDAEKQATAAAEATKKLEEAKRAQAANLKIRQKAGAATQPLGTMGDTMEETLREIKSRH